MEFELRLFGCAPYKKGEILQSAEGFEVIVIKTPQNKWYHRLLEKLGLFRPRKSFIVELKKGSY